MILKVIKYQETLITVVLGKVCETDPPFLEVGYVCGMTIGNKITGIDQRDADNFWLIDKEHIHCVPTEDIENILYLARVTSPLSVKPQSPTLRVKGRINNLE